MTNINWRWLVLWLFVLFSCQQVQAASINGKVIEINDGDEFTISNLNRPVRIKLIGMDAPEKDQAFGAAAKQHLFDLIYDKYVSVEYAGIGQHSSLIGRVLLNDMDVSAQMIRDGAAWFDVNARGLLSETQRQVYSQSEQAARNEKRGLWQADDPIAPWDFVKGVALNKNPVASLATVPVRQVKRDRPTPELNSVSLISTGSAVAQPLAALGDMSWSDGSIARSWRHFQATGTAFSAVLPEGGKQMVKSVPFGDQMISVNYYLVRDGDSIYELVWMAGPFLGETDSAAIDSASDGFIRGVTSGFGNAGGGSFQCEPSAQRNISSAGYAGREFDLTKCTVPGMTRIYTKVVGNERQIYAGLVFYKEEDDNVTRFLKSLSVNARKVDGPKSKETK